MGGLEDEREGTLKLLQHGLDKFGEAGTLIRLRVIDVLCQDRDRLSVGLTLELVAALLEDEAEGNRVRHNTVVHDDEFGLGVGAKRVTVDDRGRTVGSPASVCDGDLGDESLAGINVGFSDALAEAGDLADLLEEDSLARLVTVDTNAGGVIATVLLTSKTVAEDLTDGLPVL